MTRPTCSAHGADLPCLSCDGMLAITLDQPWAWAFCHGKLLENRDWTDPRLVKGAPVAIHAGLTPRSLVELWDADAGAWMWPEGRQHPPPPEAFREIMKRGQVVFDPLRHVEETGDPASVRGAVVAVATFDRVVTGRLPSTSGQADWWARQRFAWLFSKSDPLPVPVPSIGKQELWRLSPAVTERVLELWSRGLS